MAIKIQQTGRRLSQVEQLLSTRCDALRRSATLLIQFAEPSDLARRESNLSKKLSAAIP
jgi:hypothetical protein